MKRNILLCVAGATPQIITETLYDLTIQQGKTIDEIRVITTLEGRDKIMTGIIKGRGSAEESLLHPEKGKFFEFLRDYPQVGDIEFNETKILLLRRRDGQTLEDIRTPEENELAGDQICQFVRAIYKDENFNYRVFASAAGGRKTMSIYLTLAMSLFGGAEDSLSHVLVNSDFETNPQFFYPPLTPKLIELRDGSEVSTANAKIYLAPIPFIRLRGIGLDNEEFGKARQYGEMVNEAQKVLDIREKEYDLLINLKKQTIFVRGEKVKLTNREFFFYLIYANQRLKGKDTTALKDLQQEDFHQAFIEIILATKNEDINWEDIGDFPKYQFAENMYQQLFATRNKEKDFGNFRDEFSVVVTRIRQKFEKEGIDSRYFLVSTEDGTASYQICLNSERISIV